MFHMFRQLVYGKTSIIFTELLLRNTFVILIKVQWSTFEWLSSHGLRKKCESILSIPSFVSLTFFIVAYNCLSKDCNWRINVSSPTSTIYKHCWCLSLQMSIEVVVLSHQTRSQTKITRDLPWRRMRVRDENDMDFGDAICESLFLRMSF